MANAAKDHKSVCPTCGKIHFLCLGHKKRKNTNGIWEPCGAQPMANGTGCCRMHGGGSLSGVNHPQFKHGRRSRYKFANSELHNLFEEAQSDDTPLELRDELDLLTAIINADLKAQATGSAQLFRELEDAINDTFRAVTSGDQQGFQLGAFKVRQLLAEGKSFERRRDKVERTIDRKRKVVSTEVKRQLANHTMIHVDRVMLMLSEVAYLIKENITDPRTISRIDSGFRRIAGAAMVHDVTQSEE